MNEIERAIEDIFKSSGWEDVDRIEHIVIFFKNEINQLKQQHAEEITKIMQEVNSAKGMKELLHDDLQITKSEFQGYRQAVKDILGGEG